MGKKNYHTEVKLSEQDYNEIIKDSFEEIFE